MRAGYDGAKRKRGSKLHVAVDTLGHLLALHVTPANVDDRAEVGKLADVVHQATGGSVELIYVDQGYTGQNAAEAAKAQGVGLCVVKLAEAKKGLVPMPKRWVGKTLVRLRTKTKALRQIVCLPALCRKFSPSARYQAGVIAVPIAPVAAVHFQLMQP